MNKVAKLKELTNEKSDFDVEIKLPKILTSKEMNRLKSAIDNRLDPKKVTSDSEKIEIFDDAFQIIVDNKKQKIFIAGDANVKTDVEAAIKDAKIK